MSFLLASTSPRRLDLLRAAGYGFRVVPADVSEIHEDTALPDELTRRNARLKTSAVAELHPDQLVLGADTLVSIDGCCLGKPAGREEARLMLARLVGRTHEVCTAVCLIPGSRVTEAREFTVVTRVTFKPLTPEEIGEYLTLINPLDKAGSYAAQEHGERIIAGVDGSWTNVVGLPMKEVTAILAEYGIHPGVAPAACSA